MDKLKEAFNSLLQGDKAEVILFFTRIGVLFLFFLSLYLPFIFDVALIDGKVSMSKFPGSLFYELVIFFSIPAYFYLYLIKNTHAKKVLLVQAIIATLVFLYGVMLYRFGAEDTATAGFGKHLEFILLIIIWFTYVKEALTISLINKFILKTEVEDQAPEVEEEITE